VKDLCIKCHKVPPHGYLTGKGIFLAHLCRNCFIKGSKNDNYVDGGDTKIRSKTPVGGGKSDSNNN
jgi:hypothetical protein